MQINSINASQAVPVVKATSSQAPSTTTDNSDRAEFNLSADSFSSLVQRANQMPEVRTELVDAYKSRIHSGHYPAQDVIDGLIHLIGGTVKQAAQSGTSSSSSENQ